MQKRKKRINRRPIAWLLVVVQLLMLFTVSVSAEDPVTGGFGFPGGSWSYTVTGTKLVIAVDSSGVTSVQAALPDEAITGITEIEFASGITEVQAVFFRNCSQITTFTFAESVTKVYTGSNQLAENVQFIGLAEGELDRSTNSEPSQDTTDTGTTTTGQGTYDDPRVFDTAYYSKLSVSELTAEGTDLVAYILVKPTESAVYTIRYFGMGLGDLQGYAPTVVEPANVAAVSSEPALARFNFTQDTEYLVKLSVPNTVNGMVEIKVFSGDNEPATPGMGGGPAGPVLVGDGTETSPLIVGTGSVNISSKIDFTADSDRVVYIQFTAPVTSTYTFNVGLPENMDVTPTIALLTSGITADQDGYDFVGGTDYLFKVTLPKEVNGTPVIIDIKDINATYPDMGDQGNGLPQGATAIPVTQLGTPIDITSALYPYDQNGLWMIAYLSFTPDTTGAYNYTVDTYDTETEGCMPPGVPGLMGSSSAVRNMETGEYIGKGGNELTAGTEYIIRAIIPTTYSRSYGATFTINQGEMEGPEGGIGGGQTNINWPAPGSENESKIIDVGAGVKNLDIQNYLVELDQNFNAGYITVTPNEPGVYKIEVVIPAGHNPTNIAFGPAMTFRCGDPAQMSNGTMMSSGDYAEAATYYRLEAGRTYRFELPIHKEVIPDEGVLLTVERADCPLRTYSTIVMQNKAIADIRGFYNLGGSDESVTVTDENVVIDATADNAAGVNEVSVSIEAASAATLDESQVESATFETDVADVAFDTTAVATIAAVNAPLALDVSTTETSDSLTVSLNMSAFGEEVLPESTSDENGLVTVSVPYELEAGNELVVDYISPDGTEVSVEATYDEDSNSAVFSTNHFSDYRITQKQAPGVELKPGCDGITDCATKDYADVDKEAWYHTEGYLDYVVTRGVMTGTSTNPLLFAPEANVTRAQMVEALWKMEGKPQITAEEAAAASLAFTDVKQDGWYANSINWAYTEGLAAGIGDQKFAPNDLLTREQMVTFLYRYAAYKGADVTGGTKSDRFSDWDQVSEYAVPAMIWAVHSEIIIGMDTTPESIMPKGTATRSQLAKVLTVYLMMLD